MKKYLLFYIVFISLYKTVCGQEYISFYSGLNWPDGTTSASNLRSDADNQEFTAYTGCVYADVSMTGSNWRSTSYPKYSNCGATYGFGMELSVDWTNCTSTNTMTITFKSASGGSATEYPVIFSVLGLNSYACGAAVGSRWIDKVTIQGYKADLTTTTNPTITKQCANATVSGNTITGTNSCGTGNTNNAADISFSSVAKIVITYTSGTGEPPSLSCSGSPAGLASGDNPIQQEIYISAFKITSSGSSAPTAITGTTNICNGGSTTLTGTGATSGSKWYTGSCGGTEVGTGTSISVSPTSGTVYYVDNGGLCSRTSCAYNIVSVSDYSATLSGSDPVASCIPVDATAITLSADPTGTSTTYSWYYQDGVPTCPSGTSTTGWTFISSISDALFSEGFENAGSLPTGWGVDNLTDGFSDVYVRTSTTTPKASPQEGSYFVEYDSYNVPSPDQSRLKSPSFSSSGKTGLKLNFYWYHYKRSTQNGDLNSEPGTAKNDKVTLQYSTNGTSWTTVGSDILRYDASLSGWTLKSITLPAACENQATLYIGFLFTSAAGHDCYIDNVAVTYSNSPAISQYDPPSGVMQDRTYALFIKENKGNCSTSGEWATNCRKVDTNQPSNTSLTGNDYLWTGATNTTYETATNWLKWNSTTSKFETVAAAPTTSDNVYIKPNGTCISAQPTVTTTGAQSNNITIAASATLTSNNATTLTVAGSWSNSGTYTENQGKIVFTGTGKTITCTGGETFYNLDFNSGSTVTTNNNVTITNALNLAGQVTTGANIFYLNNTAADATAFPTTSGSIKGTFRRNVPNPIASSTTYKFPVARTSDGVRLLAELTSSNLAGLTYIDGFVSSITESGNNIQSLLDVNNKCREDADGGQYSPLSTLLNTAEWDLTPNIAPTSGSYSVNLYVANVTGLSGADDNKFAVVKRLSSSTTYADWDAFAASTTIATLGSAGRIYNSGNGYAQKNGFTSFSKFAIAKAPFILPVELSYFKANCANKNQAELMWQTLTEKNSDRFEIEKSYDGEIYNVIASMPAAGNSNSPRNYVYLDNLNLDETTYYRLNQYDIDGTKNILDTKTVNCEKNTLELDVIFPVPVVENLNLIISSSYNRIIKLDIYNTIGQLIYSNNISITAGKSNYTFNNFEIANATYLLKITDATDQTLFVAKQFVINK